MTLNITDIELFTLLKAKIGEKEATAVIDYVKQETLAGNTKTYEYFSKDLANLQSHIDLKHEQTKSDTAAKIEQSKNEMYKALYITSFIQILSIIGGILAISKFFK